MKHTTRKIISYTGQTVVVLFALFLFWAVGESLSTYDVVYSGGTDDARWYTEGSLGADDINDLIVWGVYLIVTSLHVLLYYGKLLNPEKKFNWWTLPTFDLGRSNTFCIVLSAVFTAIFLYIKIMMDFTMPEVFMPTVSYLDMKESTGGYSGTDSFYAGIYWCYWIVFTFFTTIHILIYILRAYYNKKTSEKPQ